MKKKILLAIIAVILLFTGAFVAANYLKEPAKADGTTIAWIDAPLDKMRLPLEPYEIVFHASDASAIVKGEITINGQLLVELDTNYKESLVSFRHVWTPVSEGEYIIEARGQNDSGQWSEPAKVLVYIGALEPTETPTPVFTYTPTFTATPSPTPTATPTVTPTPGPAPITFINPHVNTNQIYWGGSGTCGREEVDFYVTVPPAAEVSWVKVRYRVIDLDGIYPPTEWGEKQMYLNNAYNGEWLVSVKGYNMFPLGTRSASHGRVEYYFVAFRYADNATASSSVKNDLRLDYCSN